MSGGGKFRSGDTVPPQMLGQDPSLDRALSKLNQQLDPDEDALYVKPGWSERPDVSLTPISQQITQELVPDAIDALQQGERTSSSSPEQTTAGMSDLYKRRMITVQTPTVPRGETGAEAVEDGVEPVPPAVELGEPPIREDQRTVIPRRLALLIGVAAAALVLLLGALLGHDMGRKGHEQAQTSATSANAAEAAMAGTAKATAGAAKATATAAPETSSSATADPAESAKTGHAPSAEPVAAPAPSVTARQGSSARPKVSAPKAPAPAPAKSSKPNVGFEPVSSDFTSP